MRQRLSTLTKIYLIWICYLIAGSAAARSLQYEVFAAGKHLGTSTETSHWLGGKDSGTRQISLHTKLKMKTLFITIFSLESRETDVVGPDGLQHHQSHTKINDQTFDIRADRRDSLIHFQIDQKDSTVQHSLSLADFDISSLEPLPLGQWSQGERRTLKILQPESALVEKTEFVRLENESLTVNGHPVECLVFQVLTAQSQSKRWYAVNDQETLVQEIGTDEDGSFRITLKNLNQGERRDQ